MKALLLPGLDGHHVLYESFEAELQRHGVQAVRGSLPRSSAPSYGDLARDVVVPTEPFVLVAESFSGPLAVALAHRHTPLVKALVLISTFLTCPLPGLPWLAPTLPSALFGIAPPAPLLRWAMLGLDAPDGAVNALAKAIADTPPEVTRNRVRLVAAVDMKVPFQALTLPTLSLRARGDRLVPETAQRTMAKLRRGMDAITLDGPHLLLQRNPEGTARAIGAFLHRTVSGT